MLLAAPFARIMREVPGPHAAIGAAGAGDARGPHRAGDCGVLFGLLTAAFSAMTVPAVLVLMLPVVVISGYLTDERLW